MNIILRVVNRKIKASLFIDENLKIHNQKEVISLLKCQKIDNLSMVKKNRKIYLRTKPNAKTVDNIINKSIFHTRFVSFYKDYSKANTSQRIKRYDEIRRKHSKKTFVIVRDDRGDFVSTKTDDDIINHIRKYRSTILKSAKKQEINPFLLGAILIDEYCRMGWDDWIDWFGALNIKDTSVGIAQIKLSTARDILKKEYYNPAPGKITFKSSSIQIWWYLNQPEHSIQFSAAAIRLAIVYWQKKKIDITNQPKVLAYLYSAGHNKEIKNAVTRRCAQISTEFYQMAKPMLL